MRKRTIIQFSIDGILALIGLGDLFVPEIKSWIFAGVIWGIAVIWAIFILVLWINDRKIQKQVESIKLNENVKSEVNLKIGAKVNHISTYPYSAKAFGQTEFMSGKQIVADVTLFTPKQMKIDSIDIELLGKRYSSKEPSNMIIKDSQSYKFSFDIPDIEAINTNEAVIKVFSANIPYSSNPFEIDFNESIK